MFDSKKKSTNRLLKSFGQLKDDFFNFALIEKYFRKRNNSDAFQVLSDKTCNDVDFQELFMFVDRTSSKVGQQYLYNKLRVIPSKPGNANDEIIIEKLMRDTDFRIPIQRQLEKLNKNEAYHIGPLFQDEHLKPPEWFFIVRLLSLTSILLLIAAFINPPVILFLLIVFIINMGIHYWNKKNLYQYLGSIPQLLKLNSIARELYKSDMLKKINPDVPASISLIDKVRNRMLFFRFESKLEDDTQAIFWSILELFKVLFLIEPLLLFGVLKRLDNKRKEIEEVFLFIGQIDSLLSIASLRSGLEQYCIPEIVENKKEMRAENIYHPLVPGCIKNNISVTDKSILLTGSNMSGKTSFIRAIGINAITALSLNTCFADYFSLPKLRIYSAIRISDDLMNNRSYYLEEVLTIKEMVEKSVQGKQNLFLLDEIYKGTNTVERISAGRAVLSWLASPGNIVFVSTHDIELADLLKDEYELYHFSERVDNNTVDFDYKLKEGKLKHRNAIRILEINDYPERIIEEAIRTAAEMDRVAETSRKTIT